MLLACGGLGLGLLECGGLGIGLLECRGLGLGLLESVEGECRRLRLGLLVRGAWDSSPLASEGLWERGSREACRPRRRRLAAVSSASDACSRATCMKRTREGAIWPNTCEVLATLLAWKSVRNQGNERARM